MPLPLLRFALGCYLSLGVWAIVIVARRQRARIFGLGLLLVAVGGIGGLMNNAAAVPFFALLLAGALIAGIGTVSGRAVWPSRPGPLMLLVVALVLFALFAPVHP